MESGRPQNLPNRSDTEGSDTQDFADAPRVLRMETVIVLTYLPMAVFAIAQLLGIPFLLAQIDSEAARIIAASGSAEAAESIRALADHAEAPWFWASTIGMTFTGLGALVTVWARRHLEGRMTRIVEYAEIAMSGRAIGELPARADDVVGRLASDISRIAHGIARRDAQLRTEAAKQLFDSQLQRAFAMVDTEEEALQIARRAMEHLVPSQGAELLLSKPDELKLIPVVSASSQPPRCSVRTPSGCSAVRCGQTLIFPDSHSIDACPKLLQRDQPVEAAVCAPVTIMGATVGVLHVAMKSSAPLDPAVIQEFESLISHFSSRIGIMRMLKRSRFEAERDPLTGLRNRRSLEKQAQTIFESGETCTVAIADLDKFKSLNDEHGHEAGDRALKLFARVLTETLRPTDIVARFGGEEFVLMLPGCDQVSAFDALERVRFALAEASTRYKGPPFTSSFGLAEFPTHGQDMEELLSLADRALYKAKENGRDRVESLRESIRSTFQETTDGFD